MKEKDLEKFRSNVDELFAALYNIGRNVAESESYTIDKSDLMDELDKSYLDDKWADDVHSKRKEFVDLCWNVLHWGWFESNK